MPTPEELRGALEEMAKQRGPAVSNIARVKSVDENNATCVLIDEDGQEFFEVRLRPVLNDNKSVMIIPKVNSYVLAVRVEDDDDWFIVGYDQIEKVGYYINNTVFEFDATGFKFQKDAETLKQLMSDLIAAIKAMSFTLTTPDTINGSTTALMNLAQFEAVETRFNDFLK
ncbi:MAG: hypothetical protein C0525_01330 [Flavobacterium sp.]|uniref:hypothetical protein n=1 Tax=Flavobacterium sp. TaxID=239 RepID=UPI0025BE3922|nr:hypothetical protein [Flavobacterium sp.]MBA4133343.1 hypothetical protein [Flavobacterium sp.]